MPENTSTNPDGSEHRQLVLEEPTEDYAVELEERLDAQGNAYQLVALQPLGGGPTHRFRLDDPALRFWRRRHPELDQLLSDGEPGGKPARPAATGVYAEAVAPERPPTYPSGSSA